MSVGTKPTLTYFNFAGRGEVPRLILELAGADYEWVGLSFHGSEGGDWGEYKSQHGEALAFGQVPRYQDPEAGLDLVQSNAITRCLAQKHGFNGANETEAALIDQFNEGIGEFGLCGGKAVFPPPGEDPSKVAELRGKFLSEDMPKWLGFFERALAKNGTGYFVGENVSYADLQLLVVLHFLFRMEGVREGLENFPRVKATYEKVANLPKVKAYYDSKPYSF
ncbi:Glutathione S-transferase P [Balamuthia mandrillaris]